MVKQKIKEWFIVIAWWISAGTMIVGVFFVVAGYDLGVFLFGVGMVGIIIFFLQAIIMDINYQKKIKRIVSETYD